MTVIAVTREMGSLGKDVAAGLAEQLGLRVIHHELVEHDIAQRLGVQESAVHHYLEGNATLLERWKIDRHKLSRFTAEEILGLAREGDVIIRGWGATGVLRHIPHVLRVRICAPMAFRERVMMERLNLSDASAVRREIERSDAAHAGTVRGFFGVDWQNPLLYHLVLNTGSVPVATCVSVIRQLAESPAFQETDDTRSALTDRLLESQVRTLLDGLLPVNTTGTVLDVAVARGVVTLKGVSNRSEDLDIAIAKIRELQGVKGVETEVRRTPGPLGI